MMHIKHQRAFISNLHKHMGTTVQCDLAEAIGIGAPILSKLYNEPKPGMKISTLITISEHSGIKVSTLAGWLVGE